MGLFDKKYCSICGEKIGLLGNRKLEDGNLCKNCANKLSPFFGERRRSTVEDIRTQLRYREDNKTAVAAFHTTLSFGDNVKILIDEDNRKFVVTDERDLMKANPDVIDFSMVTGVDVVIDEDAEEEFAANSEGEEISYTPPRFSYSYDFKVVIRVNHPYFDTISVDINDESVYTTQRAVPERAKPIPENNINYRRYKEMCDEVREILLGSRKQAREEAAAAAAPPTIMHCSCCGANSVPDSSGCCAYCGSPLK